jgi:hypothetical protein
MATTQPTNTERFCVVIVVGINSARAAYFARPSLYVAEADVIRYRPVCFDLLRIFADVLAAAFSTGWRRVSDSVPLVIFGRAYSTCL